MVWLAGAGAKLVTKDSDGGRGEKVWVDDDRGSPTYRLDAPSKDGKDHHSEFHLHSKSGKVVATGLKALVTFAKLCNSNTIEGLISKDNEVDNSFCIGISEQFLEKYVSLFDISYVKDIKYNK